MTNPTDHASGVQRSGGSEGVGAADIIGTMRAGLDTMSDNQQRVARLFLEQPDWAVKANVEEIAARAGVGAATITRFARLVGCEGLKDLKLKLAGAMALGAPYLHRSVRVGETAAGVLQNVTGSVITVLSDWQRRLSPDILDQAADAITAARRIVCLGTGATSNFMAQDLQARLFRFGLQAQAFADAHYQLIAAATAEPGDVLVAISYVGRMPNLLRAVELARSRGVTVIAIAQSNTPLSALADIHLQIDVPRDATLLVGTDAYVVQLMAIEMLMILVGLRQGPALAGRMNALNHVVSSYGLDSEAQADLHESWHDLLTANDPQQGE
jgi:DNA-binding MurR/RpiR family transcriptional regulator